MASDAQVVFDTSLDESGLKRGLTKLGSSSQGLLSGLGASLGMMATTMAAGVVSGLSQMVSDSISTASRLQEVQNVVDVTFGESASSINEWAKAAKEAYGMGELKAKQFSSTIGAMFKSMGMSGAQIVDMSKAITGLSGDMASFYNLDYDTAFEKLRSGISGETEPLKQLGINMSVANLEAFALSNGIKKTYEKMTQAEQVTLRYNYLMQVTADAQGDFARTSEGYANQQRILQTTQEELAATIGEVLLPVAVEATKMLNTLVGGLADGVKAVSNFLNPPKSDLDNQIDAAKKAVDDFNDSISSAGKNLDTSLASAKATQATAMSLLKNYEAIQSKNVLTDSDTAQLRTIARQIIDLYPDMGTAINSATGLFNVNTGAVKDNIKALADQQTAMAYYAATQEFQAALLKASVAEQMAADAYQASWDKWQVDKDALDSLNQIEAVVRNDIYAVEAFSSQLIAFNPEFEKWFDTAEDGTKTLNDLGRQAIANGDVNRELENTVTRLTTAEAKSSAATAGLDADLKSARESTANASEEMAIATETLTEYGDAFKPPIEGTEELVTVTEKATRKYPPFISMLKAEREETTRLQAALKTLSDKTLQQIDAQINGYEKIKKVRPKSTKQTTKDVNSQTKYLEDYAANFKKAQEKGVSTEALTSLAEVTDENAAILAGLAKASETEITNFNAAVEARDTERTELSTELAGFLTDLTTANTTLDTAIAGAGPIATQASENVFRKLRGVGADSKTEADGVSKAAADVKTAKENIKTSADEAQGAVKSMVTGISTIVDDNGETLITAGAEITGQVANGVAKNNAIETVVRGQVVRGIAKARGEAGAGTGVGVAIVNGIGIGAQSKGNWLNQILQQIIKNALAAARSAAEVNSPSKLFARELGSPLAEGIGYGFSKTMDGVTSNIARSISASAKQGQAILGNTLLGRLSASGFSVSGMPSLDHMNVSALNGSMLAGLPGGNTSSNTTITETQEINFNYPVQAPDEVARAIRRQRTYGLAGMRK